LGWENRRADRDICDYVLDSDFNPGNPRHFRFPIWASFGVHQFTAKKNVQAFMNKPKFCCMLVSNPKAKERIEFFNRLSEYKKVDSAGRYLNNVGHYVEDKIAFIRDYKFVISFENSSYPGYTTEKLIEPMLANCIPVYWGDPDVGKNFNTRSFINIKDTSSFDTAIKQIIELDNNTDKYLEMVNEPWFNNNEVPDKFNPKDLLDFFDFIIADSRTRTPVALSVIKSNLHKLVLLKRKTKSALSSKIKNYNIFNTRKF
jgi:hypothetical protein